MANQIINKIGTAALARTCLRADSSPKGQAPVLQRGPHTVPLFCLADSWKRWDDTFPPPLEDIFEGVPSHLLRIVAPTKQEE
jgi:hypothetical protein